MNKLDELFLTKSGFSRTGYHALKRLPKSPAISHFKELLTHHDWLLSFGDTGKYLAEITKIKLQQFAAEAKSFLKMIDCFVILKKLTFTSDITNPILYGDVNVRLSRSGRDSEPLCPL